MNDSASEQGETVFISFSSLLSPQTAQALIGAVAAQVNGGASHIYLVLSTPGGRVADGICTYNCLRAMPARLTTHNVGTVDSIGNVLFLAGEERYASRISSFMFHGVGFETPGPARFEAKDLRERLGGLTKDEKLIADVIVDRTNIKAEEAKGLFFEAAFMRADEARKKGLIHEVRELQVPQGARFLQLTFK